MSLDKLTATDQVAATTKYNTMPADTMSMDGKYYAVCYGADGQVKWEEPIQNMVVTVGQNLTLDTILGNSAAGAVVMGLKGTGTVAATDTQASHPGWLEVGGTNAPAYSGNRPTPVTGQFRFNTTLTQFEGYNGTAWGAVGGGATGGGTDEIFIENGQTVTTNYTISTNNNAGTFGPITVNSGVVVTVPSGSTWSIV